MKFVIYFFAAITFMLNVQARASIEIKVEDFSPPSEIQQRVIDRYSYNFGRVWLNSSQYASYRLTNTGSTPLTFQSASVSGIDFSASHSCVGKLAPQQVCRFDIRYSPFFAGFNSGRFILSFIENLDIVVDLWGEGYRL